MTRRERKLLIQTALVGVTITALVALIDYAGGLSAIERWFYDRRVEDCQFFTPAPTDKLVHLDIDDSVLELLGAWPWPRRKLAAMIDEVHNAGTRVLAMDVILPEKQEVDLIRNARGEIEEIDNDATLAKSLKSFGNVLVPIAISNLPEHSTIYDRMRAILLTDIEISSDKMEERLRDEGFNVGSLRSGADSSRFVHARVEAMALLVNEAIKVNPEITVSELRQKLLPQAVTQPGLHTTAGRLFDKQYEKILSMNLLRRHVLAKWPTDAEVMKVAVDQPPIRVLSEAAGLTGYVYYEPDPDGLLRSIVLFANHEGYLWPQLGLSLACRYLGVDLADLKISKNRIEIPFKDGRSLVIPVHSRRSQKTGLTTDLHMDLAWFGKSEDWASMYDPKHEQPAQHVPLSKVWSIIESRDRIRNNNRAADDAILAIWHILAPDKRERYEKRSLAMDDPLSRLDVIDLVLKDVAESGYMDVYAAMSDAELKQDPDGSVFVASVKALKTIRTVSPEMKSQRDERAGWLREQLEGKAAIIGWTGTGTIADFVPSPLFSKVPGVVAHGVVFNSILNGEVWRSASPWVTTLITALLGLLMVAGLCKFSPQGASVTAIGLVLGYFVINGVVLFDYGNLIVGVAGPLTAVIVTWAGCTLFRFVLERAERTRITRRFQNYVDPALVDYVIQHPEKYRLEGEEKELTVVFTDLAGFTTLTERLGANSVAILNEYTELMVPIIKAENGYLNKFMGDGMMFFYGAPWDSAYHAMDAVITGLRMQEMMPIFNASLTERGLPNVAVRVGACSGKMIVGDAGSANRSDYTVLGDVVNLAARLESANKYTGTKIMINDECHAIIGDKFLMRPVGRLQVKGKTEGVMTFEPLCKIDDATDELRRLATMSDDVVSAYVTSNFKACLAAIEAYVAVFGEMKLMDLYRDLCTEYLAEGAPEDFKGAIVLESK